MKRIIRHGEQYANAIFLRECCNCGCQFEYERKDVEKSNTVSGTVWNSGTWPARNAVM